MMISAMLTCLAAFRQNRDGGGAGFGQFHVLPGNDIRVPTGQILVVDLIYWRQAITWVMYASGKGRPLKL